MIRKTIATALLPLAILNISACTATTGVRPDANITTSFVRGVSTLSDVEAKLGQPVKSMSNPDGSSTVTFHYGDAQISPLILVGVVTSGHDVITVVNFDSHGKFASISQETDNRRLVSAQ
jgi:hypothetical protein